MPDSESKKKWTRDNTMIVSVKLNRNTDADIIKKLHSEPTRQGYIKALIRQDIASSKRE